VAINASLPAEVARDFPFFTNLFFPVVYISVLTSGIQIGKFLTIYFHSWVDQTVSDLWKTWSWTV